MHDTIFDRGREGVNACIIVFRRRGRQVLMVYKCNISKIKGQFLRNNFVYEVKGSALAPVLPLHRHYSHDVIVCIQCARYAPLSEPYR